MWETLRAGRQNARIALALILVAAFGLRVYGLDWDAGHLFHPDERHILMVTQQLALPQPISLATIANNDSPLNPKSFAYGSLSFYLLAIVTHLAVKLSPIWQPFLGHPLQADLADMRLIGRIISASFDTGTVLLTFLLGRRLYGERIGLLAAIFVAFAVIHIQLSHFYASDTILTFFILLAMLATLRLADRPGIKESTLAGTALGLALATKISAAPFVAIIVLAHTLRLVSTMPALSKQSWRDRWRTILESPKVGEAFHSLNLSATAAVVVFVLVQPYAVFDFNTFLRHIIEQSDMVRGIADLPYTRQYVNTTPYLYHLQNLVIWGLGFPLGLLSLVGLAYAAIRVARRPRQPEILLLSWVLIYFAITGSFHAKFMRYMLPIVPFICLFGAVAINSAWRRIQNSPILISFTISNLKTNSLTDSLKRPVSANPSHSAFHQTEQSRPTFVRQLRSTHSYGLAISELGSLAVLASAASIILLTVLYALAFLSIYTRPHTAVSASKWIYENVPQGSAIAAEHWEEGMPVPLESSGRLLSATSQQYRINVLELYEPDSPAKQSHIAERLAKSDYIVFFSNRLYGSIPRLPDRYPLTTRYYQLLFGEQLGFKLAAAFTSYPSIFGMTFVDDTFSDPGLPTPALLRDFRPAAVTLNLGKADESLTVYDHPKVLIFKKTESLTVEELRARLGDPSPPRVKTSLLFSEDEKREMAAAGTFAQMFNRNGIENQVPILIWIVLVQVIGLAATPIAFKVLGGLSDKGYGEAKALGMLLVGWLVWLVASVGLLPNVKETAILALVLLIVVGAVLYASGWQAIRGFLQEQRWLITANELIFWGAFALFLAIRVANPDLWHPYRGGEKPMDLAFLIATMKSVHFPPYDPWFAGGYMNYYYLGQVIVGTIIKLSGIIPTTAYNLAVPTLYALTASCIFSIVYSLVAKAQERSIHPRALLTGLLAVVFALLLGNLGGALQVIDQIRRTALNSTQASNGVSQVGETLLLAIQQLGHLNIPTDWYWASTRVIEGTINEFPFFTFLYADLHAHMIALPFTMLVLAFAVSFVRISNSPLGLSGYSLPTLLMAGLALGALYVANSWDFPTYAVILCLAILLPGRRLDLTTIKMGFYAALILGFSLMLYLPFYGSFQSFYSGIDPSPGKSDLRGYLIIHGLFLFVLVTFLLAYLTVSSKDSVILRSINLACKSAGRGERFARLYFRLVKNVRSPLHWRNYLLATALALLILLELHVAALLLSVLFIAVSILLKCKSSPEETFIVGLIVIGLLLGIGVEFFAIKGDVGRMNTVFKFYLQVWMLWSVASAFAASWMIRHISKWKFPLGKYIWVSLLAILMAGAAVYPVLGTRARVADRFDTTVGATLDGTAFMQRAVYADEGGNITLANDLKAIRWIQDNIPGSPVVLEAQTPFYRWGSRISVYTGLPTVLGWEWHERQQRWGYQWMIDKRLSDVKTMYTSPSIEQTIALLKEYNVAYIYVGELERLYYPSAGLQKFDTMAGTYLEIVYDDASVKIYKVKG